MQNYPNKPKSQALEPEHDGQIFVWQNVCTHLRAHTKFRPKCSGSLYCEFFL